MVNSIIKKLIEKGVTIPNPESVCISDDVDPDRISCENVVLYAGTKIFGSRSLILKNTQIGYEAPVCLENTLVGEDTRLNGGFFKQAIFLGHNTVGSGAHVREGTIFEEQANAAHTVGLKQTILFPFVTLGSLINFCDCFMAGGTDRVNHSEVGSSFVHFNYTPNQDKATPSMIGDIHNGVMLKSKPIFLGGQGGIVGPVRINYGCLSAAGSIIRKNQLEQNRIILGRAFKDMSMPRQFDIYTNIAHIFNSNIYYIAGLIALNSWYTYIRPLFAKNKLAKHLIQGLQDTLILCITERIRRFEIFCDKLVLSKEKILSKQKEIRPDVVKKHDDAIQKKQLALKTFDHHLINNTLNKTGESFVRQIIQKTKLSDLDYISFIQHLNSTEQSLGRQWLKEIQNPMIDLLSI